MLFLLEHRLYSHLSLKRALCQENFDTKYGVTFDQQIYGQQPDAEPVLGPNFRAVFLECGCSTSRRLPLSLQTSLNPQLRDHSLAIRTAQIRYRIITVNQTAPRNERGFSS